VLAAIQPKTGGEAGYDIINITPVVYKNEGKGMKNGEKISTIGWGRATLTAGGMDDEPCRFRYSR
jgi:hypothetical protein